MKYAIGFCLAFVLLMSSCIITPDDMIVQVEIRNRTTETLIIDTGVYMFFRPVYRAIEFGSSATISVRAGRRVSARGEETGIIWDRRIFHQTNSPFTHTWIIIDPEIIDLLGRNHILPCLP
ncbi:MAG: hypothetical protein FWC65_01470 [Treponema sp.]|nr:hypothetical protein [Treponema sp.]